MLARPAPAPARGFEIYMTRRSAGSAFAPDAFVFPGGALEGDGDAGSAARARTLGLEPGRVREEFARATVSPELPAAVPPADPAAAAGLLVAALRELFEEAGLLIARTAGGAPVDAAHAFSAEIQAERDRLRTGDLAFADFLARHDWFADARELTLFSHWITPASEPRRFDTRFFFARAPQDQAGRADAFETHDGIWISPFDALARYRAGDFHLVYPTIKHLERLAPLHSLDEAVEFARGKAIVTILPATQTGPFAIPATLEDAW
jgi:8-oxo-dGTP pyrophosphatase MutT (NUDIX family)